MTPVGCGRVRDRLDRDLSAIASRSVDRPIGMFDSGFGGLTVARAVIDLLPAEELVYIGDTGRYPYGPKPLADVRRLRPPTGVEPGQGLRRESHHRRLQHRSGSRSRRPAWRDAGARHRRDRARRRGPRSGDDQRPRRRDRHGRHDRLGRLRARRRHGRRRGRRRRRPGIGRLPGVRRVRRARRDDR